MIGNDGINKENFVKFDIVYHNFLGPHGKAFRLFVSKEPKTQYLNLSKYAVLTLVHLTE